MNGISNAAKAASAAAPDPAPPPVPAADSTPPPPGAGGVEGAGAGAVGAVKEERGTRRGGSVPCPAGATKRFPPRAVPGVTTVPAAMTGDGARRADAVGDAVRAGLRVAGTLLVPGEGCVAATVPAGTLLAMVVDDGTVEDDDGADVPPTAVPAVA